LTNANHTIQGHGDIGANTIAITNEVGGLIHANATGGSIILDPANTPNAFVNSGTLRASNNSTLVLSGNGLGEFSGNGPIIVDADGTVQTLSNPLVSAGPVTLNGIWSNTASANITVTNFRGTGQLNLSGGSFTVRAGGGTAGTSRIKDLTITLARLDLTDHDLVIDYDAAEASPIATIRGYLQTGFANGAWTGQGIRTSHGTSNGYGIGYAEATGIFTSFPAVFSGQEVDNTTVLLKFTRFGDADFSGNVNLNDFNRLAANFGASGRDWSGGDFNYDGLVNLSDFNLLAANFGLSASPGGPTPEDWSTLASTVPEPCALGVLGIGLLLARRRRSG
jgi:hypothetical protein